MRLWLAGPAAGWLAAFTTVAIWAGFALTIRLVGPASLSAADAGLVRFAVPLLVLLPFLPSRWAAIRRVKPLDLLMVMAGAGLPYWFLVAVGARATSAAHVSALIAGTLPMWVAGVAWAMEGQRVGRARWRGIGLIVAGVALLVLPQTTHLSFSFVFGALCLLGASLSWALYTLGLRRSGLDAIACTLAANIASVLLLPPMMLAGVVETHLGHIDPWAAVPFVVVQGLGSGVLASLTYSAAIRRIGASRTAVFTSLTPALVALLAVPLLGEPLGLMVALGVLTISAGVVLFNRAPPAP